MKAEPQGPTMQIRPSDSLVGGSAPNYWTNLQYCSGLTYPGILDRDQAKRPKVNTGLQRPTQSVLCIYSYLIGFIDSYRLASCVPWPLPNHRCGPGYEARWLVIVYPSLVGQPIRKKSEGSGDLCMLSSEILRSIL